MKRQIFVVFLLLGFLFQPLNVFSEEQITVSAQEFRELKEGYKELKSEVRQLRKELRESRGMASTSEEMPPAVASDVSKLKKEIKKERPGLTNLLIAGYAGADYIDEENASSNFTANFNPILLWKLTKKLLFEGEVEFELDDEETEVNLEYAQITYLLTDFITVGVGKFLSPFGIFRERLHPKWINKLPDAPLGYAEGPNLIVPKAQIGAQLRGGVPLWDEMKANYAFWVSNGPELETEEDNAGELNFNNTNDNNTNKALGWRFGFLPLPEFEVGYSLQVAKAGEDGTEFSHVDSVLQGLDATYVKECDLLKGFIDLRTEWIWSDVDRADYETDGGRFRNKRRAGYVQAAYRPSYGGPILENIESVVRYGTIELPKNAPNNQDIDRLTFGLNYYLNSSTVFKAAYRIEDRDGADDENAFLLEAAMGF